MKLLAIVAGLLVVVPIAAAQSAPSLRVSMTATGPSGIVRLDWTAMSGVNCYRVRKSNTFTNGWTELAPLCNSLTWSQALAQNTVVFYQVVPVDANGSPIGPASNYAMASNYPYAASITPGTTRIAASHITELRSVVTAVRSSTGLSAPSWFQPGLTTGYHIMNEDVEDLRTAFQGVVVDTLGLPAPSYTDPGSLQGVKVRKAHVQQIRSFLRAYPETVWFSSALNNPYFSPNGDDARDTTTFTATVTFAAGSAHADFHWLLNIRNSSNAVVRTAAGNGTAVVYVWDGLNGSGAVQPDGAYTFELVDADSQALAIGTAFVTIDNTPPSAAIASPVTGTTISNVRENGNGTLTVTGNANDAHFSTWVLERTGNGQQSISLANGVTAIPATTQLTVWQTLAGSPNGTYALRLTATDAAANKAEASVNVTVSHFTASQDVHQANPAIGERVRYTSVIPFPLTETLTIRNAAGQAVKTLVNEPRQAGTRNDDWDGTSDAGQLVGNGVYRFDAVVTEGSSTMTWNESGQIIGTGGKTQLQYPQCQTSNGAWTFCGDTDVTFDFDPYTNKPLRLRYCVGSGVPDTCGASGPALVVAKMATASEGSGECDNYCLLSEYQASGAHEIVSFGRSISGADVSAIPYVLIVRKYDSIEKNLTVVYGMPVTMSVTITRPMFNPAAGTTGAGGSPLLQEYHLTVGTYGGRQVTIKAQFRNTSSNSILRTIDLGPVTAGNIVLAWDGRADSGVWVAPGIYEAIITATDSAGGTATIKPLAVIRY